MNLVWTEKLPFCVSWQGWNTQGKTSLWLLVGENYNVVTNICDLYTYKSHFWPCSGPPGEARLLRPCPAALMDQLLQCRPAISLALGNFLCLLGLIRSLRSQQWGSWPHTPSLKIKEYRLKVEAPLNRGIEVCKLGTVSSCWEGEAFQRLLNHDHVSLHKQGWSFILQNKWAMCPRNLEFEVYLFIFLNNSFYFLII